MKTYKENYNLFRQKAQELVDKMTLEEVASQLKYDSPSIERLNIPAYNWWNEALHGVARAGVATMFPQAIALAAMFDEEAIKTVGEIIATEGRAKYNEQSKQGDRDIYKGLTFWSPNINIFRDPRWGRGHETYGEDPYLTARLGVAYIKGLQGDGEYMKAAACAKHFAVHSGPEAKRHKFNAKVSKRDMEDTYLPAFEACVKEANVEAIMGAYNRTNDEPCCASKTLIQDILIKNWGFKGHFVSDCWAIQDFHAEHMITSNAPESAALALNNGCDLNCGVTYLHLLQAYKDGLVTEQSIRNSAVRLFTTRYKLGLFDENCEFNQIPYELNDCKKHNDISADMSRKAMVLLKNNGILPLKKENIKSIAVVGPNAYSINALVGNYFGTSSKYITNLQGIQDYLQDEVRVYYSEGCHLFKDRISDLAWNNDRLSEAITVANNSDIVILCLGLDSTIEGEAGDTGNSFEGGDKKDLELPKCQQILLDKLVKTGKPIVLVVNTGSAIDLRYAQQHCAAIIQAWYNGSYSGKALAELIFGEYSPCGKLPITFYNSIEELPDFEDYSMKNRTYRYFKQKPLYPFGYGLSYTKFEYSNLQLSSNKIGKNDDLNLEVTVKNIGNMDSDEIVQIYIKDNESSQIIPNVSLCGFQHIHLKSKQSKVLEFTIKNDSFKVVDKDGNKFVELGTFTIYVGGSQPDDRSFELTGTKCLEAIVTVK